MDFVIFAETPDGNLPADLTDAKLGVREVGQWLPRFAVVVAVISNAKVTKLGDNHPALLDDFILLVTENHVHWIVEEEAAFMEPIEDEYFCRSDGSCKGHKSFVFLGMEYHLPCHRG